MNVYILYVILLHGVGIFVLYIGSSSSKMSTDLGGCYVLRKPPLIFLASIASSLTRKAIFEKNEKKKQKNSHSPVCSDTHAIRKKNEKQEKKKRKAKNPTQTENLFPLFSLNNAPSHNPLNMLLVSCRCRMRRLRPICWSSSSSSRGTFNSESDSLLRRFLLKGALKSLC
jgi:hypothetical protein